MLCVVRHYHTQRNPPRAAVLAVRVLEGNCATRVALAFDAKLQRESAFVHGA